MSNNLDYEKIAEFLAVAGMTMSQADGFVDDRETDFLNKIVAKFTSQPENYLYSNNKEDLSQRLDTICAYWGKYDDNFRYCLLGMILGIACSDDVFHEKEKLFLFELAKHLKIKEKQVKQTLKMANVRVKSKSNFLKNAFLGMVYSVKIPLNKLFTRLSLSQEHKIAEFIASTGMLMMVVDGEIAPSEVEKINQIVSNFTSLPEQSLRYTNEDLLLARIVKICSYWSKKNEYYKHFLVGIIQGIATADGIVHEREKELLGDIEKWLKIENI